jgi:ribonuclease P protein component
VLAKANRITSADDYRGVVRRGAKVAGAHTVSYVRSRESGTDARFGVIVSKKVGTAVRRNLVRRRIKAVGHEIVTDGAQGFDLVVRALPSAATADFSSLRDEVRRAAERGAGRTGLRDLANRAHASASAGTTVREEASGA